MWLITRQCTTMQNSNWRYKRLRIWTGPIKLIIIIWPEYHIFIFDSGKPREKCKSVHITIDCCLSVLITFAFFSFSFYLHFRSGTAAIIVSSEVQPGCARSSILGREFDLASPANSARALRSPQRIGTLDQDFRHNTPNNICIGD